MGNYEDVYMHTFKTQGADSAAASMRNQGKELGSLAGYSKRAGETMMGLSPVFSEMGAKSNELSREWAATYREAGLIDARLEALGAQRGMSPAAVQSIKDMAEAMMQKSGFDDEAIKQSAVTMMNFGMSAEQVNAVMPLLIRQSRTLGQPLENLSMAMGKGFGSGNLGAMRKMGITIDDASMSAWKLASKTVDWGNAASAASLRALVLEGAMKGIDQTAMPLDAIMQTAAARADLFAANMDNVKESLGAGAAAVEEKKRALLGLGLGYMAAHEEQAKFVGGAVALGGPVLSAAGTVGGLARNLLDMRAMANLARGAKAGLREATLLDTAAERTKTGVAQAEAAAIAETGIAAKGAAVQKGLLARAGAAMTGGLGMGGLLNAGAGAALTGGLGAGAMATSIGLAGLAAGGGWMAGSAIARGMNIGGAGDLAKANAATKALESELGGSVGGAVTADMLARYRQSRGIVGRARTTPGGDLRVTIPGDQVLTAQAAQDYAMLE